VLVRGDELTESFIVVVPSATTLACHSLHNNNKNAKPEDIVLARETVALP
jgi:hypothetical protein